MPTQSGPAPVRRSSPRASARPSSASTNDFAVTQERDGTTTLTGLVQDQANFTVCSPASGTSASPSSACRWSGPSQPVTRGTKSRGPGRDLRDVAICGSHQFGVAPPVSERSPTVLLGGAATPRAYVPGCTRSHGMRGVSGQGPATRRRSCPPLGRRPAGAFEGEGCRPDLADAGRPGMARRPLGSRPLATRSGCHRSPEIVGNPIDVRRTTQRRARPPRGPDQPC